MNDIDEVAQDIRQGVRMPLKSQIKPRAHFINKMNLQENDSTANRYVDANNFSQIEREAQLGSSPLDIVSGEFMEGIEAHGDEILSTGQATDVAQSFGETRNSRGTMQTDRWRALNADIFDMKLKVKVSSQSPNNIKAATSGGFNKRLNPMDAEAMNLNQSVTITKAIKTS